MLLISHLVSLRGANYRTNGYSKYIMETDIKYNSYLNIYKKVLYEDLDVYIILVYFMIAFQKHQIQYDFHENDGRIHAYLPFYV